MSTRSAYVEQGSDARVLLLEIEFDSFETLS
jgi:hypothetical protein